MMAHNLCYSTLVPRYKAKNYKDDEITKTPNGDYFVKPSVKNPEAEAWLPPVIEEPVEDAADVTNDAADNTEETQA